MEMTMQDRQRQLNSGECPVCHGTGWEITLEILEGYREPFANARGKYPEKKGRHGTAAFPAGRTEKGVRTWERS